jgi:oligoribonuclease
VGAIVASLVAVGSGCVPTVSAPAGARTSLHNVSERAADRLVWVDCEMTGLELGRDALIEVAVIVTDADLTALDDGLDVVIHASDEALDSMIPFVRDMHATSGLTEAVRNSTVDLGRAEQLVLDYVKSHVPEPRSAPLCGNSIATDRGFLARDMPTLDEHLHYRMVDVSSLKELAKRWYPSVYHSQPAKGLAHRALADITESIRELAYYRRTLFVERPGPTLDQARAVASELLADVPAGGPAGDTTGSDGQVN